MIYFLIEIALGLLNIVLALCGKSKLSILNYIIAGICFGFAAAIAIQEWL